MADDLYFALQKAKDAQEQFRYGTRDFRNPELRSFFEGREVPSSELATRYNAVRVLHEEVGITPISQSEFSVQAGTPSQEFFLQFMGSYGFEIRYTEDLVQVSGSESIPQLGFRTSFIKEQSADRSLSVSEVRDLIRSRERNMAPSVPHLALGDPIVVADSDSAVASKLGRMRKYAGYYLGL